MAGRSRRIRVVLIVSTLCLVVGLSASWDLLSAIRDQPLSLPLEPFRFDARLERSAALPAPNGALAGRSVVLVTLDTLRPDRLGCYGNAELETPVIDALAAEGVLFANAVATAPTTLPAHASILTGLYPHNHGARVNGQFELGSGPKTLGEQLSREGYATAAFVSAFVLDRRYGLARGFSVYDDRATQASGLGGYAERRGDATTDAAIAWLEQRDQRPYFLWVHYYDAHALYQAPSDFRERAENDYDAEIAFVDHELGRLLAAARKASAEEPLVVVTADHSESLGEHGEVVHGLLVQEASIRIPLIMAAPGALAGGSLVETRISQVDIMPSILGLLGVRIPAGLDGVDFTGSPDPDRPIFAESVGGTISNGWAPLTAIYRGNRKYIDGPNPEYYDLGGGALDRTNQLPSRADEAASLAAELAAVSASAGDVLGQPRRVVTDEEVSRLSVT